jgi:hypothetical protein
MRVSRVLVGVVLACVVNAGGGIAFAAPGDPEPGVDAGAGEALLPEDEQGRDVLEHRSDLVPAIADANGLSEAELTEQLHDATVWVDTTGQLFYADTVVDHGDEVTDVAPGPFPYSQTFLLHSKPDSTKTIFLDFDGHVVNGSKWPADDAGPYSALPFNMDGVAGFSNAERDAIQSIWQRVAEDYSPWDVDVTTQDPGEDDIHRSSDADQTFGTRVLITNSPAAAFTTVSQTGVAWPGVFDDVGQDHILGQPALVFPAGVTFDTKDTAELVTHEAGHTLGLRHDGTMVPDEDYYFGHSRWAPIMGAGYVQPVVQFSKGEYASADNSQDDLAVITAHGLSVRPDDHTNALNSATELVTAASGIITPGPSLDADLFRFVAPVSGLTTFSANPAPVSPNLDIVLRLYSSTVVELAVNDPAAARVGEDVATGLGASIQYNVVAGTSYYLQVLPTGVDTPSTGYSTYGSLGQYTVSVTAPTAAICPPDDGFEQNDTPATARAITSGATNAAVVCAGDDDYFSIAASAGDTIAVDALFLHSRGDVDVYLYNPDGTVAGKGESTDDDEHFAADATQTGTYVVRVLGYQGAQNSYQLKATVSSGPIVAGFAASQSSVAERTLSDVIHELPVTRGSGGAAGTYSVSIEPAGTASLSDFTVLTPSVSLAAGQATTNVRVAVHGDALVESDETFQLRLTPVGTGAVGPTATHTVTIVSDDIAVSIASVSVAEGTGPGTLASVAVSLSRPLNPDNGTLTVQFASAPYTASAGTDYVAPAGGTFAFTPGGPATVTLDATVVGDGDDEPDEAFVWGIAPAQVTSGPNPAGVQAVSDLGAVVIVDDDLALTPLFVTRPLVGEGTGFGISVMNFRITGAIVNAQNVSFTCSITSGSAVAGIDFLGSCGTYTFGPGEVVDVTIPVEIAQDFDVEGDESLTLTLVPIAGAFDAVGPAAGVIVDDDRPCTIIGRGRITGTSGNDVICGSPGRDVIRGLGGHDVIRGFGGNDSLDGGAGNDTLDGGAGNDTIRGGDGNDIGLGRSGRDNINGGAGTDIFDGGSDNDTLNGSTGRDGLIGNSGNDTIVGSAGDDLLLGLDGNDRLDGSAGNDELRGGRGSDRLSGSSGNDLMLGGDGNDTLLGSAGDDTLFGEAGNDSLNGSTGTNALDGGPGIDMCLPRSAVTRISCER